MASTSKDVQIIFDRVPHADGTHKTITFHTKTINDCVYCRDIFEYLEDSTDIPKKYFTLIHKKTTIRYIDVFIRYYHDSSGDTNSFIRPEFPHDMIRVRVQTNIDYHIYNYYSYALRDSNYAMKDNDNISLYNEFLKFADDLFSKHRVNEINDIMLDPCYLSYMCLFDNSSLYHTLSPIKRFRISTNIELIKKKYSSNEITTMNRVNAAL